MARSVNGFVGTYSSLASITAARQPSEYAGCSANIGTAAPYQKAWCNGIEWYTIDGASNPNIIEIGFGSFVADTTGTTDTSSVFIAAVQAVANSASIGPAALSDARSTKVIELPPGRFLITQINGLLGQETHSSKTSGLIFKGAGRGATQIIFQPSVAGALCTNNKWLDVQFKDIEFVAKTAGCTLFTTPGTSNEQEYTFDTCAFHNFKYVLSLLGTNNNSEILFHKCNNYAMEQAGAWLYIPASGTSDQFLNYWFTQCKHWSTSAPLVDIAAGGHVHITDTDISDWGTTAVASPATPAEGTYVFKLKGTNHNLGVTSFTVKNVRLEAKNANAKVLYSEWGGYGSISFSNFDMSSQTSVYTYSATTFYLYLPASNGAYYSFQDSMLAGGLTIEYSSSAWQYDHRISVKNSTWFQKAGAGDVVVFVASGGHGNTNTPIVEFENCRGTSTAYNFSAATAYNVWDASIGGMGIPGVGSSATRIYQKKRTIILNSVYSGLQGSDVGYIRLPLGAVITDCQAMCNTGGSAQASAGTWTIQLDKAGSPTTVATLTTPGNLSAGFNVGGALAIPFNCNTTAKQIVSITPSSVTSAGGTLVSISGYW